MNITAVYASNFLSFLPLPLEHAFEPVATLDTSLTVIVGPNGAGKTNVLRIIDTITQAAKHMHRWNSQATESVFPHATDKNFPIQLGMDVELNSHECAMLRAAWLAALELNDIQNHEFPLSIIENDRSRTIALKDERIALYNAQLESTVDVGDVAPLCTGHVRVTYDAVVRTRRNLVYRFSVCQNTYELSLRGHSGGAHVITPVTTSPPARHISVRNRALESYSKVQQEAVARFLDGQATALPVLPACDITTLLGAHPNDATSSLSLDTMFGSERTPTAIRQQFNRIMGRPINEDVRTSVADTLLMLLQRHIVPPMYGVNILSQEPLSDDSDNIDHYLQEHRLPLYLFRLKNGSQKDRTQFEAIQKWFKHITETGLDVQIITEPEQSTSSLSPSINLTSVVRLVTDGDIPLDLSGSGRLHLMYLATILSQPEGKIILLDEPDAFLYPALQFELAQQMLKTPAQFIITTHSATLVRAAEPLRIRRLVISQDNSSIIRALPPTENVQGSELKQWVTDEGLLFLFYDGVVFVEGEADAAVLPLWLEQWKARQPPDLRRRQDIRWHPAGSNTAIHLWIGVAQAFDVPWLAIYDRDTVTQSTKTSIMQHWRSLGFLSDKTLDIDNAATVMDAVYHGSQQRIFFCGTSKYPSLEKIPLFRTHQKEIKELKKLFSKGQSYRHIAKEYPDEFSVEEYPQLDRFFQRVATLGQSEHIVQEKENTHVPTD